jgi:regulator of replication initiation timing
MTSETDAEFLDSMEAWVIGSLVFKAEHRERLFALARRGAEAADRIERLREANEMVLTDIRRTDVDMLAFKAEIERLTGERDRQYNENVSLIAENERLRAALREWESAMNRLSMRVGLTAKDIADVLNPIMDTTRAALDEERT